MSLCPPTYHYPHIHPPLQHLSTILSTCPCIFTRSPAHLPAIHRSVTCLHFSYPSLLPPAALTLTQVAVQHPPIPHPSICSSLNHHPQHARPPLTHPPTHPRLRPSISHSLTHPPTWVSLSNPSVCPPIHLPTQAPTHQVEAPGGRGRVETELPRSAEKAPAAEPHGRGCTTSPASAGLGAEGHPSPLRARILHLRSNGLAAGP